MPLYDFKCENCGLNFEALTGVGQYPRCPECDSHNTRRMVSAPKNYIMNGDNGGSTTPKRFDHGEERRKHAKRDRMTQYYSKNGIKI